MSDFDYLNADDVPTKAPSAAAKNPSEKCETLGEE